MLIKTAADFSDILKFFTINLGEVKCTENAIPIPFPARVSNNQTFNRLAGFEFQPGITSFSRLIGAMALLSDNPLEAHLLYRFEKSRSFFHHFTHTVCGTGLDR